MSLRNLAAAAAAALTLIPAAAQSDNTKGEPPHIDSVTMRTVTVRYMTVYPDFTFHDPDGDAWFIRRMLVDTDRMEPFGIRDGIIDILPDHQKAGAVYTGGWPCGPEKYFVTLRAFIVDRAGNTSNTVEYTIHCNGG